jgi:hypothetical protein
LEVIKWQQGPISTLEREEEIDLSYLPALSDSLDWGPHHVDLATQNQMRLCYFRRPHSLIDTSHLDLYSQRLRDGADVLFWGEPVLGSCLGILWALDALVTRDTPLDRACLALSPARSYRQSLTPAALQQCLEERVPVEEFLEPLVALRRHTASDIRLSPPDLSTLPPRVREWVALTQLMTDFVPDRCGLDLIDSLLLNNLTEEWQKGVQVVAKSCGQTPPGHEFGDGRLW